MPKKGRPPLDPLRHIASSGFIGYVEEEEVVHPSDEPGVIWVGPDKIHDNPYQHAEEINPDDFQALVESIKADGFQGALNVSPLPEQEGHYFLTSGGHQRRDAARRAGLSKLPVFVADAPTDRIVLALRVARENTTRVNTSIINLGHLYQQMIDEFHLTQEQVAQAIGKDRNHVKFALMAVRSPADIQAMLRQKPDSVRAMVYFRRLERAEDRKPIMERFLTGDLSTDDVRREIEAMLEGPKQNTPASQPIEQRQPESAVPRDAQGQPEKTEASPPARIVPAPAPSMPSPVPNVVITYQPTSDEVPMTARHSSAASFLAGELPSSQSRLSGIDDRIQQARVVLHTLQAYRQHVTPDARLAEEERQILEEIQHLAQRLLEQKNH